MSRRDMDDMDMVVARRILHSREKAGLTQIDLGKRLGVTFQQVQKYEKGKNRISAGRLWAVADACGVTVQSMFDEVPVETTEGHSGKEAVQEAVA